MKNVKVSLVLNCFVVLFVTIGCVFMFNGIYFMPNKTLLEVRNFGMLKFYTVDSNILIGLVSLILIIYEILLLKNKIKEIPNRIYILKLIGVSSIALTFITTLCFLAPQYGFYAMYNNNNLFFHLIVPILALVSYIFYEKHDNKYGYAILGVIPMFLYSIYYTGNIIMHLNNKGLTFKYDFYGFLNGNINNAYIVIPVIFFVTYLISLLIILMNKKIANN